MPKGARKDACALQKNKNAGQQRGTVISRVADARARRKSQSAMHFLPNVAGGMKPTTICKRPRGDQVLPIATVFKPGWTCMTPKKAEHAEMIWFHSFAMRALWHLRLGYSL